jgi:hypothetical protein
MFFLSVSASWLARGIGDAILQAETGYAIPRDSSTLRLGLIGISTVVAYLLALWRPRRTTAEPKNRPASERISRGELEILADRPSRDAA